MRILVLLLASSTAILGAACAYLLSRDRPERTDAAGVDERAADTRIEALVAEREQLRREVERGRSAEPCEESAAVALPSARGEGAAGNQGVASARIGSGRGMFERLAPEHRRTLIRQRYGAIFHELALSDADSDALLLVLGSYDDATRPGAPRPIPADPRMAHEREQAIARVLGADKAAQFAELERGMPARAEARMLVTQLENAGAPLSADQQRQLTAAMKDVGPFAPPLEPGTPPQEARERFRSWRAERQKVVHALAAPVLTPRQLQRLEESEALEAALHAAMPAPPSF